MRLVVIGAYTLDELQEQVVRCFSDVPAHPRGEPSLLDMTRTNANTWEETCRSGIKDYGMPFAPASLARIYRVVPVRERHSLNITWQVPPQGSNWRSKPCDYIAHLIGHEAAGSLLSALKAKSLVTACYAGVGSGGYENASSHALFNLTFTLSEEGVSHWGEIVTEIYNYIGMIRYYCATQDGLPSWIYEELRAIQDVAYKFEDEMTPEELVENIVEDMAPAFSLPPERLLDGNSLLFEYDGDAIKDIVDNFLVPRNARLDLMSSTFGRDADYDGLDETNEPVNETVNKIDEEEDSGGTFSIESLPPPQKEPMFGTKFWSNPISEALLKEWESATSPCLPSDSSLLSLPPLNPFVPTKFDLKPCPLDDTHHPLLHCSLKILDTGKKATVTKFNSSKKQILLLYEDRDEKWHEVDLVLASAIDITPDFEGTLDKNSIKFKIVAVPKEEGSTLDCSDNGDFSIDIRLSFPPIPPPLPESRLPQLVVDTQALRLWHLQDRTFKRPIAELRLKVICSHANKTPLHKACADLFVTLCQDAVTEISYLASVCELGSSISSTDQGFSLRVHGFDHKLLDLASEVLKVFFSFHNQQDPNKLPDTIKPGRFDACLEVLMRRYANAGMQASSLCTDVRLRCIRPTIWSSHSKADAFKFIDESSFMETITSILSEVSIEAFYHGNVDHSDALTAKELVLNALTASGSCDIPKENYPLQHVLKAPLVTDDHIVVTPTKDSKEANTAVEVYFQIGKDDLSHRVLIDLLSEIMYEPLFDELRTKEQFGYHVSCGARWTFGVIGISFKVVTSCKSADEVSERLDRFLHEFRDKLATMEEEKFMENLVGLVKNKLQMYNSLEEECNSLWSEINEGRYDWEAYRNEADHLRSITKERVMTAFDDWLSPKCEQGNAKERRRLVVHVIGTSEGPASDGRPIIESDKLGKEIDQRVKAFHEAAGHATWGKIL
uniref:Peptidase M16 C-terminal domain-containing protein n=2 Tax=Ditylum brightwellii TaxID=49249 RepID=A0A7S4UXX9_9STRA